MNFPTYMSLLPILISPFLASPISNTYCIGSPKPIFEITNLTFTKELHNSANPAHVNSLECVDFNFADIYHGYSTHCTASISNYRMTPFDGSKAYHCADGNATTFQFSEDGTVDMMHRWTCDTPATSEYFAAKSNGTVTWTCEKVDNGSMVAEVCRQTEVFSPDPTLVAPKYL